MAENYTGPDACVLMHCMMMFSIVSLHCEQQDGFIGKNKRTVASSIKRTILVILASALNRRETSQVNN